MSAAAPARSNQFGRVSRLELAAAASAGRTVLPTISSTMPFRVMRPFSCGDGVMVGNGPRAARAQGTLAAPLEVMVMSASAGIMAGDEQVERVQVGAGAALRVTTQSFEKVHRMEPGERARRVVHLAVEPGGYLDFSPQPQIPFADSAFEAQTEVDLADATAVLVYEEVLSCGRAARGERFAYRSYRNHVIARVAGAPVYLDNTRYEPSAMPLEGLGFYEGFSHLGTLLVVNAGIDDAAYARARDALVDTVGVIGLGARTPAAPAGPDEVAGGITRLGSGDVLVRILGNRAQRITDVFARVRALL